MDIKWQIGRDDVARIKTLVRQQANNPFVQARRNRNLAEDKPQVRKKRFWKEMVSARLTSVQRSGPKSAVARLIGTEPFPLRYNAIGAVENIETLISQTLEDFGGIWTYNKIAKELAANFELLEDGDWATVIRQCNSLRQPVSHPDERIADERKVADYIREKFKGFGPKQSRNLLQNLGLTLYEIPIDVRITDWLNDFGFPNHLGATALADINYYKFVSDGIQALCVKSGVFPCILDASIFSLKDGDDWTDANTK